MQRSARCGRRKKGRLCGGRWRGWVDAAFRRGRPARGPEGRAPPRFGGFSVSSHHRQPLLGHRRIPLPRPVRRRSPERAREGLPRGPRARTGHPHHYGGWQLPGQARSLEGAAPSRRTRLFPRQPRSSTALDSRPERARPPGSLATALAPQEECLPLPRPPPLLAAGRPLRRDWRPRRPIASPPSLAGPMARPGAREWRGGTGRRQSSAGRWPGRARGASRRGRREQAGRRSARR